MGCWNETCAISQLPIMYLQDVVYILLQRNTDKVCCDSSCYIDTYFKPYPIILYGKYDDYGCMEDITGDVEAFYELIEKQLKCTEDDIINSYKHRYGEYTKEDKTRAYLKYLQDVQRNEDCYHNVTPDNVNIAGVMIHRDLFDKLKTFNQNDWFKSKDELIQEYYDIFTYRKKYKKLLEKDEDAAVDLILKYSFCTNRYFAKVNLTEVNKQSIEDLFGIMHSMNILRKMWFPQTCAGSQTTIEEQNKILAKYYNDVIKQYEDDMNE